MLHALIMFAAAEEGTEASKTPFYLAGGLFVVFAILVSVLGITRSGFPASKAAARGVMALAALLMVFVMATAVITG